MATEGKPAFSLDLRAGMNVEVLTLDNKLTFLGRIDRFNGQMVEVSDGAGRETPPVVFGTEVKLRGFLQGLQPFEVLGKVSGSTDWFWRIDELTGQPMHERFYYRQTVSLDVQVFRVTEGDAGPKSVGSSNILDVSYYTDEQEDPPRPEACRILDISCGGVGLRTRARFETGDALVLREVQLAPGGTPFTLRGRVRNVQQQGIFFRYGCELEGLDERERDRLLAAILQLQRQTIQSRRK